MSSQSPSQPLTVARSPDGMPIVAYIVCYNGPIAAGEAAIARLRSFAPALADTVQPMAYVDVQAMLDEVGPKLKTGKQMLSESIRADTREGDIGTELGEVADAHPDVSIGSYPFFDDKLGPNTNVVIRSREPEKLAAAKAAVETMLKAVKAKLRTG